MHFIASSVAINVLGILPLGTLISPFFQSILISERFAVKMLDPFFATLENYSEKRTFLRHNYFTLIGFALPLVWLSAIPIVNMVFLVYAQAGAAHLLNMCETNVKEKQK